MKGKNHLRRSASALMAALVVLGGAAAFGGALPVSAYEPVEVVDAAVQNASYLSADAVIKGTSVTVYGKSGMSGASYAYFYKKHTSEKWTTIKSYSQTKSVKFTPAAAVAYDVRVDIKDSTGTVSRKNLSLNVYAPLVNNSKVSKEQIYLGSSVTMKGVATGGSGTYEYAFYYKKTDTDTWKTLQKYSAERLATFKPTSSGEYDLMIKVKNDVGGIAKKTFTLSVAPKIANTSTVTPTVVEKGGKVLVSASATGGAGGYTFSYSYKRKENPNWTLISSYSDMQAFYLTMTGEGEYQILIKAKDSAGNVSSKTVPVRVTVAGLDEQVASINSTIIKSGMSEYEKVKAIHDWIINNTDYDVEGVRSGNVPATSFTAKGLFDTHIAVCDGYSKAFEAMAGQAGLEVNRVVGTAFNGNSNESHSWNQVRVDGKWYNIDVTWDDPTENGKPGNNLYYNYFLVPDSVMDQNHFASGSKNTCTAEQPLDKLMPELAAIEEADGSKVTVCENTAQLKLAVAAMSPSVEKTYKFIYKTEDISDVFQMIRDYRPNGYYYTNMAWREWKLLGYYLVTVKITPA